MAKIESELLEKINPSDFKNYWIIISCDGESQRYLASDIVEKEAGYLKMLFHNYSENEKLNMVNELNIEFKPMDASIDNDFNLTVKNLNAAMNVMHIILDRFHSKSSNRKLYFAIKEKGNRKEIYNENP
jgi:hypothetical protein